MDAWDLLAEIDRDAQVDPCTDDACRVERSGVADWSPSPVSTRCGVIAAAGVAYAVAVRRGVADESVPVLQMLRYRWDEDTRTMVAPWWKTVATGDDVFGALPHGRGDETYRVIYETAGGAA